jgi:hypothetical protein
VAELTPDPNTLIEVAKEFGGGFVAYWTHHVFHKVWHATGHFKRKGGKTH